MSILFAAQPFPAVCEHKPVALQAHTSRAMAPTRALHVKLENTPQRPANRNALLVLPILIVMQAALV